ncbi:MAG: insulinase family protein [Bacilli bacterium]|nr:insulinase family protein [Bacilli bacterium]
MKYKKTSTYSYNLHVIKTDKFKTITVKINFKRKLQKQEITYRNMIVNMLCESTALYPSKRLMTIATENLYDLYYRGMNYISGKYNVMGFDVTFLNEEYTEEGMLDESIKFLSNLVFKPNIEKKRNGTCFNEDNFKLAYNLLKDNIIAQKENPDAYSRTRMLEHMEPDSYLSYRSSGYLEDLESIDSKKLYKYYESILNSDIIDIFVIGNVNERHVRKVIEDNFLKIKTIKKPTESHFIRPKKTRLVPKTIKEKQNINQSKLVLGYKIDKMTDYELRYVLNIYSYILGGGPDSKLFKTVREKNSLCYYISSVGQPLNSILTINAGINKKDFKNALNLIKREVYNMKKGKFTDEDIIKGKITYINSLKELEDSETSIISLYAGIEYLGSDDIPTRFAKINKVSKNDVIKLANKIHLDTIYLLEGDLDEEK